ncbi:MAG: hypothetical protein AB7K09_18130 [Planctomycetota bacterium]
MPDRTTHERGRSRLDSWSRNLLGSGLAVQVLSIGAYLWFGTTPLIVCLSLSGALLAAGSVCVFVSSLRKPAVTFALRTAPKTQTAAHAAPPSTSSTTDDN